MNSPTWYMPALADDVLIALRTSTEQAVRNVTELSRIGIANDVSIARQKEWVALVDLINDELVSRQTKQLAKLIS